MLGACSDETSVGTTGDTSVSGVIVDEQGYIVPDAIVEALNASNQVLATDTTDDDGAFVLAGLPSDLGALKVHVDHEGFKPSTTDLSAAVGTAGGRSGLSLNLLHDGDGCGRIAVSVADDSTGDPVVGAEVRLRRGESLVTKTRSDSLGNAVFEFLRAGTYSLRIARDGYLVVERTVELGECDSVMVELEMHGSGGGHETTNDSCCNGVLTIVPKDSATGEAISGAEVRIGRSGSEPRKTISGGEGSTFREVCSGVYNVRIAREGYAVVEFTQTVGCDDTVTIDRLLVRNSGSDDSCCNGSITVVVRDSASGSALSGATVKIWRNGALMGTKTTNGSGVTFTDLCKGSYGFDILKEGYKHIEFTAEIGCNGSLELTRSLLAESTAPADTCCRGKIVVVVRDSATGAAVANAVVKVFKGSTLIRTLKTNGDGVAQANELCEGTYGVSISREGYKGTETDVDMTCNSEVRVERTIAKNTTTDPGDCCTASLKLRVRDASVNDGGWLSGVVVVIKKNDSTIADGTTNGDGGYLREGLCGNATYTVAFSKSGFKSKTVSFTYGECKRIEETIALEKE